MSDTSHGHAGTHDIPTESDGVNYRGLVWFMVILAGTTFACQLIVWGMIAFMNRQAAQDDAVHPGLAAAYGAENTQCDPNPSPIESERHIQTPCIAKDGEVLGGRNSPQPNLMADDPLGLKVFREKEDEILEHYDVMDKNAGTYRIPIDRAKELLLERGIPGGTPTPAAAETPAAARRANRRPRPARSPATGPARPPRRIPPRARAPRPRARAWRRRRRRRSRACSG
jgi:hypothetical protein